MWKQKQPLDAPPAKQSGLIESMLAKTPNLLLNHGILRTPSVSGPSNRTPLILKLAESQFHRAIRVTRLSDSDLAVPCESRMLHAATPKRRRHNPCGQVRKRHVRTQCVIGYFHSLSIFCLVASKAGASRNVAGCIRLEPFWNTCGTACRSARSERE
jgi:hypothetical protein